METIPSWSTNRLDKLQFDWHLDSSFQQDNYCKNFILLNLNMCPHHKQLGKHLQRLDSRSRLDISNLLKLCSLEFLNLSYPCKHNQGYSHYTKLDHLVNKVLFRSPSNHSPSQSYSHFLSHTYRLDN